MRDESIIPSDVLAAARAAGLTAPLWYVGRRHRDVTLTTGLGAVVAAARKAAGLPAEGTGDR